MIKTIKDWLHNRRVAKWRARFAATPAELCRRSDAWAKLVGREMYRTPASLARSDKKGWK